MSVPMLRAKGKGVGFMVGARVSGGVVEWVDGRGSDCGLVWDVIVKGWIWSGD